MTVQALKLAAALTTGDERFDVVIWSHVERKVVSVTGKDLRYTGGTHNAELRLKTTQGRINLEAYSADIVPHGMYEIGDRIT